ncbi:YceI family protein [Flavobacterium sp. DGU11]|uniref:YceI family protein n=1 Tax=Flavobacterium arundinis TaxID=3139143 RepID=A0ABU9I185_9FLAO
MKRLKYIVLLLLMLCPLVFYGQKYNTRAGVLKFEASVASFEEVAAENKSASAILDASNGEIAVLALMNGFRFKVALMEEHFNENYAETSKYPKATFKGKVEGLDVAKLTSEPQAFNITGDLTMHGKTKKITDTAKISKSGNNIIITGGFQVKPADFDIEVPKMVSKKVAEKVTITYNLSLTK